MAVLGETERARERIDRALVVDPDNTSMRFDFARALNAHLDDAASA